MAKTVNTGIRLRPEQFTKLDTIATQLGLSRNGTVGRLIDLADVLEPAVPGVVVVRKTNGADPVKNTGAIL